MSTFLAVLGACAVFLGAVTAVLGWLNQRAAARAVEKAELTAGKVQQISVQVDGRLSQLLERQAQLLAAMHAAGTPIPPRPPESPPHPSALPGAAVWLVVCGRGAGLPGFQHVPALGEQLPVGRQEPAE